MTEKPGNESTINVAFDKYKNDMIQRDGDSMIWRIPPWIINSSGPVVEFLEKAIVRETDKLKNVMRAKTRKVALESQIRSDIKYLKSLLKEYNDGIIKA